MHACIFRKPHSSDQFHRQNRTMSYRSPLTPSISGPLASSVRLSAPISNAIQ